MSRRTLDEIARQIGAEVKGDGTREVSGIRGIDDAESDHLTFVANPAYMPKLQTTRAAAAIVSPEVEDAPLTLLVTAEPYRAFSEVLRIFHPPLRPEPGVSPEAWVHPTARVGEGVTVSPFAYVGANAVIGARSILHPFAHLGENAVVGEDCTLYQHVSIREGCILGNRVILHNGVVVGSDGFGFLPEGDGLQKIPQVGIVQIEDDVDVGAGTCIDRATMGKTRIGRGTKIDNLVQIAHNVQIGENAILVSQVGISGSTTIGERTVLAGQTGVAGHLTIGSDVKAAAKTGIISSVKDGSIISGAPSIDHRRHLRIHATYRQLPELRKKIRKLEKEMESIRSCIPLAKGEGEKERESDS